MPAIKIYIKPTCSTCRQVVELVRASGKQYEVTAYFDKRFDKKTLRALVDKMGLPAKEILRTKEESFLKLKLDPETLTLGQAVDLMIKHPELIQRPIVQMGERVFLARPAEKVKEIL